MPRAQFRDTIFVRALGDTLSTPPSQLLAALYDVGTSSPINEAIYVDDQTSTMLPNPIPVANDGILIFWLAEERQLDIVTFCPGYTNVRSTVLTDSTGTPTQGANGPPGEDGAIGPAGAPGTSIVWLGTWSPTTGYVVNNAVSYDGSSYLCVAPLTGGSGPATDPMHWALMAAAGESDIPGPMGPTGATGPAGPQGPQGNTGVQGPPGGAPSWRGTWSASTTYVANDAVSYQGSSYYAPSNVTLGVAPPAAPWQQIAAKGDPGPQGATGAQGPQGATGPQGANGPTGSQGPIGNTGPQGPIGNTGAQGPTGNTGPTGSQGPQGAQGVGWVTNTRAPTSGDNTYQLNTLWLNTATGQYWLLTSSAPVTWTLQANLTGPQGATGAQGAQGTTGPQGPQGPAWTPTPITITGSRHQIRSLPYVIDQLLTALATQGIIVNSTTA